MIRINVFELKAIFLKKVRGKLPRELTTEGPLTSLDLIFGTTLLNMGSDHDVTNHLKST